MIRVSDSNSCFVILSHVTHDDRVGTFKSMGPLTKGFPSRAAAEAAGRLAAANTFTNWSYQRHEVGVIELIECAGVDQ